jgi:multiple sugar transport system substrate-binding protein
VEEIMSHQPRPGGNGRPYWTRRQFLHRSGGALAALGLAPILAACPADDDVDVVPEIDPEPEPLDTELTGVLGLLLGSHMDPVAELVAEYEDAHDVAPEVEEVTTPDLASKLRTSFLARRSPWDAVFVTADLGAELVDNEWVEDVTDFLDEHVRTEGELMERGMGAVEFDGRAFAVPWTMGCPILHWNMEMMEDVGLDPEAPTTWHEEPNSWDTFIEYAIEMTGERDGAQYYGYTDAWADDHVLWTWGGLLQMHGGRFLDDDMEPVFNDEAGVEATRKLYDLLHTHEVVDPAVTTYTWVFDASPGFFEGTRGMFITWPFIAGLAADPEASEIAGSNGFAPNPAVDTSASVDGSEFFSIPVFAENVGEALRFLELVTSREGQQVVAEGGWASIYADVLEDEELLETFPFYEAIGQSYEYPVDGGWSPDRPVWTDILATEIHEVLGQAKEPQEALDDAVSEIHEARRG